MTSFDVGYRLLRDTAQLGETPLRHAKSTPPDGDSLAPLMQSVLHKS